jgi:hypothetical protein
MKLGGLMAGLAAICLLGWRPAPSLAGAPVLVYLPVIAQGCPAAAVPPAGGWLDTVNYYRATACLPPVTENMAWSSGDAKHALYTVKNNVLMHDEDTSNHWYTPEGRAAAQQSDILASSTTGTTDQSAIELWMEGPFHALGILDPHLTQVGYGSYREVKSGFEMGAGINVLAGLDYGVTPRYPVFWPSGGSHVPLNAYDGGESPSPLTSCPGYTVPSGLALIVQFGSGNPPTVTASAFSQNGQPLEHCVFDQTTYTNPDGGSQSLGRAVLGMRGAVILIPRAPLAAGLTYAASITANGQTYSWSFGVSGAALAPARPAAATTLTR